MPQTTPTIDSLIAKHGEDIAFAAEAEKVATTLEEFVEQLETAANHFDEAGIKDGEIVRDAHSTLADALDCDEEDRGAFLRKAARYLDVVEDATEDLRLML